MEKSSSWIFVARAVLTLLSTNNQEWAGFTTYISLCMYYRSFKLKAIIMTARSRPPVVARC